MSDRDQIIAVPSAPDELDQNLSAILGIDRTAPVAERPSRRTQNVGLLIALPIALILLALTVGVYRMQGWLPAQEAHPQAASSNIALAEPEPAPLPTPAPAPVAKPEPPVEVAKVEAAEPPKAVAHAPRHRTERHAKTQLADRRSYAKQTTPSARRTVSDDGQREAFDAIREMRLR